MRYREPQTRWLESRSGPSKIEVITEFSCELVQFRIAGSATSSCSCISLSQVLIGYPKFNSKLQNCQQTDVAEERPDECRVPSARGKRRDQLAAGHLAWAHVLDSGTSHDLRSGATIHHHVGVSADHWAEQSRSYHLRSGQLWQSYRPGCVKTRQSVQCPERAQHRPFWPGRQVVERFLRRNIARRWYTPTH